MRAVASLGFVLLLAAAAPALGAPAISTGPEPVAVAQAQPSTAAPPNAQAETGAQPQTAAAQSTARTPAERRRNRSYARCNRAAIARGLYGGGRRRFLIRCRLGYERGIGQPGQQAAPVPMRKP